MTILSDQAYTASQIEREIRQLIKDGLKKIPYVGWLVSDLASFLWPSDKDSVLETIKSDIETLVSVEINIKLDQDAYNRAEAALEGIHNVLKDYTDALQSEDPTTGYLQTKYLNAVTTFETTLPQLQIKGYEVLLLPLYVQAVTLNIALLRDGANFPEDLGLSGEEAQQQQDQLDALVKAANPWVSEWIASGHDMALQTANTLYGTRYGPDHDSPSIAGLTWAFEAKYDHYMTFACYDIAFMWETLASPDFDGDFPPNTRELFFNCGDLYYFPPALPSAADKPMIDHLTLWGQDDLCAVQQSYNGVAGPRYGVPDDQGPDYGGYDYPPDGWSGPVSPDNPIVSITVSSNGWISYLIVNFKDGTTAKGGGAYNRGWGDYTYALDEHIVSQLWCEGKRTGGMASNTVIVGFRLASSYS